jgi:predicted ATP-binding protein involved in virulence
MNKLKIIGLYNDFDYELSLNENLSIITAPNGFGKTTLFNILDALARKNIFYFFELEFHSIEFTFNNYQIIISKNPKNVIDFSLVKAELETIPERIRSNNYQSIGTSIREREGFESFDNLESLAELKANIDSVVLNIILVEFDGKKKSFEFGPLDFLFGTSLVSDFMFFRKLGLEFKNNLNKEQFDFKNYAIATNTLQNKLMAIIIQIEKMNLSVLFIPANRILNRDTQYIDRIQSKFKLNVEEKTSFFETKVNSTLLYGKKLSRLISDDIGRRIKTTSDEIKKEFSEIHLSLPNNLIKIYSAKKTNVKEFDDTFKKLRDQMNFLSGLFKKYTLIDADVSSISSFEAKSNDQKSFILYYIEKTLEIFKKYEDFTSKLVKIETIFNERNNGSEKRLKISKDGYEVTKEDKVFPISQLSSGEINDLILWHELIYITRKDSLVLIDEPEISLHILWQQEFIDKLMTIKALKGMEKIKIMIATHSPDIIGGYGDSVINLEDLANESRTKKSKSRI